MAEVHQLPDADKAEREASEWIARLNADDVSPKDRAEFKAWCRAHPRHARAYEELSATWREFTDAGRLVRAVSLGNAVNASTNEAIRQSVPESGLTGLSSRPNTVERQSDHQSRDFGTGRRRVLFTAAATLAAVAFGGWWWIDTLTPRTLFQTAIGEHATVELPDRSSLELNSNSRVRIDYTEQARVIHLERGEAFFNVEHDTNRPFWVIAGRSWVRAVGTAFNVYVRPSGVRVTVSEGTVKVATASSTSSSEAPSDEQLARAAVSVLTAGQQVDLQGAATEIRSLEPVELTRSVAWRSGTLYFENERLGDVVDELSRYTTLRVVVEDDALRDLPVGGTFESNPQGAEALLTMLEDGFGLKIRRDGGTALIANAQ